MLAAQSRIVEGRVEKPTKQGDHGIVETAEIIYRQGWHPESTSSVRRYGKEHNTLMAVQLAECI